MDRTAGATGVFTCTEYSPRLGSPSIGRADYPAKIALIEAVKDGGVQLDVEPPLFVRQAGNEYTEEVKAIYEGLDLF